MIDGILWIAQGTVAVRFGVLVWGGDTELVDCGSGTDSVWYPRTLWDPNQAVDCENLYLL